MALLSAMLGGALSLVTLRFLVFTSKTGWSFVLWLSEGNGGGDVVILAIFGAIIGGTILYAARTYSA